MRGQAGSFFLNSGQIVRLGLVMVDDMSLEFRVSGVKRIFSGGKSNGVKRSSTVGAVLPACDGVSQRTGKPARVCHQPAGS